MLALHGPCLVLLCIELTVLVGVKSVETPKVSACKCLNSNTYVTLLRPCLSPTGPVGLIGSDAESDGQVHGNGCEGFGEVIDQHPEEDAKGLRFTRLRIWGLYQNKLQ